MKRLAAIAIALVASGLAVGVPIASGHGGDEMALSDLKMQPAATLAQQALVELKLNGDSEDAATRLDAALESEDTGGIDMALLRRAMETVDGGHPQAAIPVLGAALSRPNGAAHGAALHEAGEEFQPATGAQEIVGITAGALLILLGVLSLRPWRRQGGTSSLAP